LGLGNLKIRKFPDGRQTARDRLEARSLRSFNAKSQIYVFGV
jgi:hypothetical protein